MTDTSPQDSQVQTAGQTDPLAQSLPANVDPIYAPIYDALLKGAKNSPSEPPVNVLTSIEEGWSRGLHPILSLVDAGMDMPSIQFLLSHAYPHRTPDASYISTDEIERWGGIQAIRTAGILPMGRTPDGYHEIICLDPFGQETYKRVINRPADTVFRTWVCSGEEFEACLQQLSAENTAIQSRLDVQASLLDDDEAELDAGSDAEAQLFFRDALSRAVAEKASDIHMELLNGDFVVRARIDGQLRTYKRIRINSRAASQQAEAIIRRTLINAQKNYNQFTALDGQIAESIGGKIINCRMSYMPGFVPASLPRPYKGEKIVMRIIGAEPIPLDHLGLSNTVLDQFREMIKFPHGLILLSGPTGSGKSTSMYAALAELANDSQAIYTIEDPPEMYFPSIHQIPVTDQMRFADALKAFMRSDPDIILVGEIRDKETATVTLQAAASGRLIMSSIHVKNAVETPIRLLDMDVEAFRVADSLVGVINQRLVRLLCAQCKTEQDPSEFPNIPWGAEGPPDVVYRESNAGCSACNYHGFRGRSVVAEAVILNPKIRTMISQNAKSALELQEAAKENGMVPIFQDALRLVRLGAVSLNEVARQIDLEDRLNQ